MSKNVPKRIRWGAGEAVFLGYNLYLAFDQDNRPVEILRLDKREGDITGLEVPQPVVEYVARLRSEVKALVRRLPKCGVTAPGNPSLHCDERVGHGGKHRAATAQGQVSWSVSGKDTKE